MKEGASATSCSKSMVLYWLYSSCGCCPHATTTFLWKLMVLFHFEGFCSLTVIIVCRSHFCLTCTSRSCFGCRQTPAFSTGSSFRSSVVGLAYQTPTSTAMTQFLVIAFQILWFWVPSPTLRFCCWFHCFFAQLPYICLSSIIFLFQVRLVYRGFNSTNPVTFGFQQGCPRANSADYQTCCRTALSLRCDGRSNLW